MVISTSAGYGLLAMGYIVKNGGKGIILSRTISKEYNMPVEYLYKILLQLVRANLLVSKRGPKGGFSLPRKIGNITMLQVVEAIDGPLMGGADLFDDPPKQKFGKNAEKVFEKAIKASKEVLKQKTIASLLGR